MAAIFVDVFKCDSSMKIVPISQLAIICTNDGLVYWRIYASLGVNHPRDTALMLISRLI